MGAITYSRSAAPPTLESEALLKFGFAPSTTKQSALAQVTAIADHANASLTLRRGLAERYLAGAGDGPERTHINTIMWRYLWQMHTATRDWAATAHKPYSPAACSSHQTLKNPYEIFEKARNHGVSRVSRNLIWFFRDS
jgi:hypothetical protein